MEQLGYDAKQNVRNTVRKFIVQNYLFGSEENDFDDTDSFLEMGIMDSTGILELIEFLEETFQITVQDDEMVPENLENIENVIIYITNKNRNG
jgi:acyl carrier protein